MWLCGMILQVKHVACSNPQKDWKLETWKWWRKISSTYTDVYHPGNAVLSFWGLLQLYHLLSLIFHSIPMWKCYRYFIPFYFHSIPIISVVIFHSIPIFHFRTKPLISPCKVQSLGRPRASEEPPPPGTGRAPASPPSAPHGSWIWIGRLVMIIINHYQLVLYKYHY
jgi:hypothetical protein